MNSFHASKTAETSKDGLLKFIELSETLAQMAKSEDIELVPFESRELNKFRALPEVVQSGVTQILSEYVSILESIKAQGQNLSYNLNSVWAAFGRYGMRPNFGLLQLLHPEDIIEIYNLDGIQVFRSFHFFRLCSYTIEDLLCSTWHDLFHRESGPDTAYFEYFGRLISGKIRDTEKMAVDAHLVRETSSPKRLVGIVEPRYVAPLFDNTKRVNGFVHIFNASPISNA